MGQVLHEIERSIIMALARPDGPDSMDEKELGQAAGLSADQVRRGVEWLRHKGLADVSESSEGTVALGPSGRAAAHGGRGGGNGGLPERRLLDMLERAGGGPVAAKDLQRALGDGFGPAMGIAKRGGWARVGAGGAVVLAGGGAGGAIARIEEVLEALAKAGEAGLSAGRLQAGEADAVAALRGRPGYIIERASKSRTARLTGRGRQAGDAMRRQDASAPAGGGGGPAAEAAAIDVEADVPAALPARLHPLTEAAEVVRGAFVALGFTEIAGPHVQPCFWNFDALFTPQDHPARDMQDTFYVEGAGSGGGAGERKRPAAMYGPPLAPADHVRAVSEAHERGWGIRWSADESRKAVLRTHTTCVTARHLAESLPGQARVFSLGRVFRNEKASYKHLAEFHQVEGVVAGAEASMRSLMGILQEFCSMIGIQKVKFWPTFFPYTEPSLQAMAYSEPHGKWVEMFGMGMLRREVTAPLGLGDAPVLAWGGGIERIAMMLHGVDDVRKFYDNDLAWLRGAPACP